MPPHSSKKSEPLPFRAHLKSARGSRVSAQSYADLPRVLRREYTTDAELRERILNSPDETLPWLFLQQEEDIGALHRVYDEDWKTALAESRKILCARVQKDLEEEGIHWNPLMDSLMASEAWEEEARENEDLTPSYRRLNNEIASWIQEQKSPRALKSWLRFPSAEAAAIVAQYANCITPTLAKDLAKHDKAISRFSQNENLSPKVIKLLQEMGWSEYRRLTQKAELKEYDKTTYNRTYWLELLHRLSEKTKDMPADRLEEMWEEITTKSYNDRWDSPRSPSQRDQMLLTMLTSPHLSRERYKEIVSLYQGKVYNLDPVILHPFATDDFQLELLNREPLYLNVSTWEVLLEKNMKLPTHLVVKAAESRSYHTNIVLHAVQHPNAGNELRLKLFEGSRPETAQRAIAQHPQLKWDRELRAALKKSTKSTVLMDLLESTTDASEWAEIYRALAVVSPRDAHNLLEDAKKWPAGVRLSRFDLAPLLSSSDSDIRLSAIRKLSQMENEALAEPVRAAEPQAELELFSQGVASSPSSRSIGK